MSEILFNYERVNPTTWAYLSSLLSLALFFKFSRFWTLRNIDLVLLILLAPALLCIKFGLEQAAAVSGSPDAATIEKLGYVWLFSVHALVLIRMLLDPLLVRRPLLEANLSVGGTTFLGVSLLLFLFANVITGEPAQADLFAAQRAEYLANLESSELENDNLAKHGPGFTLFYFLPHISTQRLIGDKDGEEVDISEAVVTAEAVDPKISTAEAITAKVVAILSQLLIVLGIVLVAARHFGNVETGIAIATFYLMLPYTAMWTGNVTHALPGALLVWAVLFYRRPLVAGILFGFLCGTIYHPIFLMPLWVTFYWRRGATRFAIGVACSLLALITTLIFTSTDFAMFLAGLQQMFNLQLPPEEGLAGIWGYWNPVYRLPLLVLFIGLSFSFILWPAQKNLGTLLSCSAALMIGTQFWHAHSGGMALAWYLP
ncbi:MAG: hypothetical protein AAGF31_02835, partial [Planctomycetota bacterium]